MKRAKLVRLSRIGYGVTNASDDEIEPVAHEVAHSILLFGRVRFWAQERISAHCARMSGRRANDHEVAVCALEIAGLRVLGYHLAIGKFLLSSFENLDRRDQRFEAPADLRAAIKRVKPSQRDIRRFVDAYRLFERMI